MYRGRGSDRDHQARPIRVALDIGHTPAVPGAIGADGTPEYEFNRKVVSLLEKTLRKQPGIFPFVVNLAGREVQLPDRSTEANAGNADALIAIHHDSVNDRYLEPYLSRGRPLFQTKKFRGFSVFFSGKNSQPDRSKELAKRIGQAMRDEGFTPALHHAEKIPGESRDLISPEIGLYRFDDLVVLRTARMPAVLLECGVIVNPDEEANLKRRETRAKLVHAISTALTRYNSERLLKNGTQETGNPL